jgi:hypothetical protein
LPSLHEQLGGLGSLDVHVGHGSQSQNGDEGRTAGSRPSDDDRRTGAAEPEEGRTTPTTAGPSRSELGLDRWM